MPSRAKYPTLSNLAKIKHVKALSLCKHRIKGVLSSVLKLKHRCFSCLKHECFIFESRMRRIIVKQRWVLCIHMLYLSKIRRIGLRLFRPQDACNRD